MKIAGFGAKLLAASFIVGLVPNAMAESGKPAPGFERAFQAKAAYCKTCHGINAQGFRGSFPMPRLAGQQTDYIKNQLTAFIERRRLNPVMNNVSHVLSPEMVDALAKHFHELNPEPLGGLSRNLSAEGKKIFQEGLPGSEVPPCGSCHGEDAKGMGEFPRLAGQLDDYVITKLKNWKHERGQDPNKPDNSAIMEPIAELLTPDQIAAVASYVSTLK